MNIIHIMKDGSVRKSVKGIVIKDERFYELLTDIQKKLIERKEK